MLLGAFVRCLLRAEAEEGQTPSCAERRDDNANTSLLFRPAGQIALVKGIVKAVERGINRKTSLRRGIMIDFATTNKMWIASIVIQSGRMSTSKSSYELAVELIAYLVGAEEMSDKLIQKLTKD